MNVTVSAEWQQIPVLDGERIEIAGYTAAVEHHPSGVWEFTVLQDHLRIVEVGQRDSLAKAKSAVEVIIQDDIAGHRSSL